MTGETAGTLREAAALMRERAEAATPGPWSQSGAGDHVHALPEEHIAGAENSLLKWNDAAHIASWHPAVALAVADWLDAEAAAEEYRLAEFGHRTASRECLAVARAYLGGDQ